MKSGTQVALAVSAGYLLGRRRKMRMAMILGGAAMTGGLGGVTGQLLRRGTKLLGSADLLGKVSPELGEVSGMITGELLPVGRAAARAAVAGRINALSDRVHERAEELRTQAGGDGGARDDDGDASARDREPGEAARGGERRQPARGSERREEARDEEPETGERPGRRPARAASSRAGAPVRRVRR